MVLYGSRGSGDSMEETIPAIVDIGSKPIVSRTAVAEGFLRLSDDSIQAVQGGQVPKGDVLQASTIAAIQAVKETPRIVPHCHPIPISSCDVDWQLKGDGILCKVEVSADWKTGVEMEAMTGVSAGLLCVFDMLKSFEKDDNGQYPTARIESVYVVEKRKQA